MAQMTTAAEIWAAIKPCQPHCIDRYKLAATAGSIKTADAVIIMLQMRERTSCKSSLTATIDIFNFIKTQTKEDTYSPTVSTLPLTNTIVVVRFKYSVS